MSIPAIVSLVGICLTSQLDPLTHVGLLAQNLESPTRLAIATDGTVLVADPANRRIVRFGADDAFIGTWPVPEGPVGIAAHPDGRYFVSLRDTGAVGIYDAAFNRTGLLGEGNPMVTFVTPTDIDVAMDTGRIYVVDSGSNRVFVFESAGTLALIFGERGELSAQFLYPTAIAVDEGNGRLIVTDQDNFRIQVFTMDGIFVRRFGYRNKYLVGGNQEGWMPRTLGVATDGAGRIYVSDALMSTVRIFDPLGVELGKVVGYGFGLGDLRTPCDLALSHDGARLYVSNVNAAQVEIYATPAWGGIAGEISATREAELTLRPAGTNWSAYDAQRGETGGHIGSAHGAKPLRRGLARTGTAPSDSSPGDGSGGPAATAQPGFDGPHMIEASIICGRCHGINAQPGGHLGLVEGQRMLCMSCHNAGGQAMGLPLHELDMGGGSQGPGRSHAWGVAAVNEAYGSAGPAVGGEMHRYLDTAGNIKCSTCHNQHNSDAGAPYLRVSNVNDAMCKECHVDQIRHTPAGGWQPDCTECHVPHDPYSTNLSLVRTTVQSETLGVPKPVLFTARSGPNSFDDGDPAVNDGICQVCHTDTSYHLHDGTGAPHNDGLTCTACHPHEAGFMPAGGDCTVCHAQPQDNGDNIPPGGRRAVVSDGTNPNDFGNTSHHVAGVVEGSDCLVCHDLSQHMQGHVRLRDPDDELVVYDYDQAAPDEMEAFCLHCHDADGAAAGPGTVPFSDGRTVPNITGVPGSLWSGSAHKGANQRCTDCHGTNAHGSDHIKLLVAPQVDTLCYQCHTDGMVVNNALSGGVNDIQEAFSLPERHNLGTNFSVGGNTYTLQCTSCHNPHVVTGKHWDVPAGVSPVTRPDLTADPVTNPRAMGNTLWGAAFGQKMDDFAALGAGTGGWYYSTARGGTLAWDQPAVYQPPKAGSGYDFEFDGGLLPDYTSLCLDCHTHRMSAANPPVNWGQGVACTDNSVDPPDQRVECGAQHGLAPAGKPLYVSDSGTAGNWGASGNPDVLFHMNYVTRGRGAGHFMRWPYDSADRSAGINFVMSCTDCHEAHGSGAASMLRSTVNAYGTGTSNWNTMCNNCHYYYGGQHAGMSCGNASCHEANSIHRIIHVTDSGAGTQLRLTAAANQADYQAPDFTPDILSVEGHIGSDQLQVTFRDAAWSNSDLTGAVDAGDFWLFGAGGNALQLITGVSHTPGDATATIAINPPLEIGDLGALTLASTGVSIWTWYDGGYQNWATGIIPAQPVSAGPWPVTITGPPLVEITLVEGVIGHDELYVTFSEAVYANTDATGDLALDDFTLTDADDGRSITSVVHTAGQSTATITLDAPLDSAGDIGVDTLAAMPDSIHDLYGTAMAGTLVTITALPDALYISAVQGIEGHRKLAVWIAGRSYANPDATGALDPSDFDFIDGGGGKSITAVDHTPGKVTATLTLDGPIEAADLGVATLAPVGASIYDIKGYPAQTTSTTLAQAIPSAISTVEGVLGSDTLRVTFETQVYGNDDETGSLNAGDFLLADVSGNDPVRSILNVVHSAGSPTAAITMSGVVDATDLDTDTLAPVGASIFGPAAGGFPLGTAPVTISAQLPPQLTRAEGAIGYDRLFVSFGEGVYSASNGTGALQVADFVFTDGNLGGAGAIIDVVHSAGDAVAIVTTDAPLIPGDIGSDTIEAVAAEVYNGIGNPAGVAPVLLTANDCPVWGTGFQLNEVQAAAVTLDDTGLLDGTVGNPVVAFPDPVNDWFHGIEDAAIADTYVDVMNNLTCLNSPRSLTIETRVRPMEVDRGNNDNTFNRVFERRRTILVTIMNTDYAGDDIPARSGKARVEVKYRVEDSSRHTCPHPQWPADPYVGSDTRMHQISSDIDRFPILDNHWYRIKVVFNSDKTEIPGSDGTPVDIFIDDQGVDGTSLPNPTPLDPAANPDFEQWAGYVNTSKRISESSSCRWGALPGDVINFRDDTDHIGTSWNHNQDFEGQIDWVTWQPVADYTGVDDLPH